MSSVTDIKYVLTQKGLEIFCETFHIPDDVHLQLPNPNQTIHEMPTGKIAAKVSHFEILCCVYGVEPTVADPTKVKIRERESAEGEARLLDSIIAHVVLLLPVVPACVDSELEASVKRIIFEENVVVEKPKRLRKKRQAAADAGSSSYPPKKLRSAYGTSSGVVHIGKYPSALKDLLANSILNVEYGIEIVATLPFVTSSVSATPEHESGVPAASVTRPNLHPIGSPERFVISLDYSYRSSTNTSGAEGDYIIRPAVVPPVVTEAVITTHISSIPFVPASKPSNKVITLVHASMFHDSESTRTMRPDVAGSSHVPGKDL
nr:hypothetical protein [Tanacetum cinerariifolium]